MGTRLMCLALMLGVTEAAFGNLVGQWKLDEGTGAVVKDSSGNGIDGAFVGAPQWAAGMLDGALQFDGASWVDCGFSPKTGVTGTMTIACWINPDKLGAILTQDRGFVGRDTAYAFKASGSKLRITTPGIRDHTTTVGTLKTGVWQHVAVTFKASTAGGCIFYIDGVETDRVDASALAAGNGPFRIANNQFANQIFIGRIDDVRLYNHILTPEEVKQLASRPNAYEPGPADKAVGVSQPLFQWKPGSSAVSHNFYLGTSPELTQADLVAPVQLGPAYYHGPGLEPGVTYYWRVDEVEADLTTVHQGDVWSFTTTPKTAWAPKPADGLTYVAPNTTLEWTPGLNMTAHDVYFGTDRAAVEAGTPETKKADKQLTLSYGLTALEPGQTYYWKVDEVAGASKVAGAVWTFTTRPVLTKTDPNLVGWWKMEDENAGVAVDSSGYDNHGTIQGPQWTRGYLGDALAFDGVDDFVDCGSAASLNAVSSVTLAAWVKPGGLGVDRKIASNQNNSSGGYKLGFYSTNKIEFEIRTSANASTLNRSVTGGAVLEADVWYHVAGVYDKGKAVRTYVNGVLDRELATPNVMGVSAGPLRLGRESYSAAYWWLGLLDDVRVYNRALSEAEIQQAMIGDPRLAQNPQPGNTVNMDIQSATELSWSAGTAAAQHDVYFGQDKDAVKNADATSPLYRGRQSTTTFALDGLVAFGGGSYFWRIDEVEADGQTLHKGNAWSFTVPGYLIVDEFESYNDKDNRIYDSWIDGYADKSNGAQVGYINAPFAERTIVHTGKQALPMDYNNAKTPFYSEAALTFVPVRDLTAEGTASLSLWFRGYPQKFAETAPGRYTISSRSGDIAGTADNFRFVYKQLDGDGSISAQVLSVTNTAPWAKAGVMVRETLTAGSAHGHMIITPSGRKAFENRSGTSGSSFSAYSPTGLIAPPYWVKIERAANLITAYYSVDGVTWVKQPDNENTAAATRSPNPQTINMGKTVYIGLLVTSNNQLTPCVAEFSDVATKGAVTGDWQIADIGPNVGNSPDRLYVTVEDSAGKSVAIPNPDPAAVTLTTWTEWKIPLNSLTGLNLAKVKKVYLGVGDKKAPVPTGTGRVFIDDIRLLEQ